jgi:hypothetical protein
MSKRTREKKRKAQSLEQLAKPDEISAGRRFAQPYAKARLLFDHPHSYRGWNIVGHCDSVKSQPQEQNLQVPQLY